MAELPWEAKHPIILDHGHDVKRLIVTDCQRKLIHAGVEHVFNNLQEKLWTLHGRAEARNQLPAPMALSVPRKSS